MSQVEYKGALAKKICLTSHELGYYKQFYPIESVQTRKCKRVAATTSVNENRSVLFLYLEKNSNKDDLVEISQRTVAKNLGVSINTVRRWQHSLVSCGLLEKVEDCDFGTKKPITYKIVRNRK